MMEPTVFSTGFLVFRRHQSLQFLLMQHADRWDLPKGHVDPGESKEQTALRELAEETGIQSKDIWIDPNFRYVDRYWLDYQPTNDKKLLKELTIYLAFLHADRPICATEHLGHRWIDWLPPHQIQLQTIDPLLAKVELLLSQQTDWPRLT